MKVKGFITVTTYDEFKPIDQRTPMGKVIISLDEIAMILSCGDAGSAVCLKDYETKVYCFDTEKEIKYKINAARGD